MNYALGSAARLIEQATRFSRILVACEDPKEASAIEQMLENKGYTDVRTTSDMREVVPLLNALAFDLLILDMHSVRVDSALLMHQIPREAVNVRMSTVALVNRGHEPSRLNALIAGACATVSRPLNRDDLIQKVGEALRPDYDRYRF